MNHDWKIRVQPASVPPFAFKATFVTRATDDDERALDSRFLYGDGDLAVLLEDLGAKAPEICLLIETLRTTPIAEIDVDVTDEAMEVLARGVRGRGMGRA
jgi:hypothetical protein